MNELYISMYHYTRDLIHSRYPEIKGLDIELFRQQIDFFSKNFNIIKMKDVIDSIKGNRSLPEKALLLTFDDGYVDNYTYAFPILSEYGVQGSFFIPGKTFREHKLLDVNKIHYILASEANRNLLQDVFERMNYYRIQGFDYKSNDELYQEYAVASRLDNKNVIFIKRMLQTVLPEEVRGHICDDLFEKYVGVSQEQMAYELYMTEEQIRTMKNSGMFIGVHGYDHYWLPNLSTDLMKKDILLALDALDEFIDKDCWVMNYPYGEYNDEVISFIEENGACAGLTTETRMADLSKDNRYVIPRFDCNDFPPKSENFRKFV